MEISEDDYMNMREGYAFLGNSAKDVFTTSQLITASEFESLSSQNKNDKL